MPEVTISHHLEVYGNPSTGKTTIARLIAELYHALGILSKGHLVETDRSGLVAGYVGQTALRVQEVVNKALGGILFIDEAYALSGKDGQDFGAEAVETLLKFMEDHREDLAVIVAGYTDKMNAFLTSNPGLKSRFNTYLRFDDYKPDQLSSIFSTFCHHAGYTLSTETQSKIEQFFTNEYNRRDLTFGNARLARNTFERAINEQANWIVGLAEVNQALLAAIEPADIPDAAAGL
jgi:SpoVK/Ycf46/Vps4 family AAA+-type ATPase